jgi:hypothetical protein
MTNPELVQTTFISLLMQALNYLPTLLTALVILLIGWLLARGLAGLTSRIAFRLGIDNLVEKSGLSEGLAQAQITRTASELISLLVFWAVFLSALLIALDFMGLAVAVIPLQGLLGYLPKILAAILILIAGSMIAQFIGRATQAAMASMGIEFNVQIGGAVRIVLLIATVIIAVQQLGVDLTLFSTALINLVTIAAAGMILAFALGGQTVVRNILAGYYAKEMFTTGEQMVIDGQSGTLEAIGTINAEVSIGTDRLILPNTQLIEKQIVLRQSADNPDDPS